MPINSFGDSIINQLGLLNKVKIPNRKLIVKRCSIIEYEDEVIVEFYDQQSKKRIEYKFDSWGEALETLSGIDF
ncbi:MAG TPA: hypothetical protein DCR37_09620 [Glaciecola sp.]|nr:hypothetical protein [Glaciecola sp.]